jgi:hypothetical protein
VRPSNKTKNKSQTWLRHGLAALLSRDWPRAYAYFQQVYQSADWQTRDLAIAGLGDMLDLRVASGEKTPMLALALGPLPSPKAGKKALDTRRSLVLLEHYPQPGLVQPQTLTELKSLQALRAAQALMEQALLADPSTYVRLSSLMLLVNLFTGERQLFILKTLERATQQENDPALKQYLQAYLA